MIIYSICVFINLFMCMGRRGKGVGGMLCERERCSIRLNSHHHRAFAIESSIHVCVYNKALTSNVKTRIQRGGSGPYQDSSVHSSVTGVAFNFVASLRFVSRLPVDLILAANSTHRRNTTRMEHKRKALCWKSNVLCICAYFKFLLACSACGQLEDCWLLL